MHELSLALKIVESAAEELQRRPGETVVAVHLRLGPLAGVVPEALCAAFELARAGTALAQARLAIEETPLVIRCAACAGPRPAVSTQDLSCADCGQPAERLLGGREMELTALELA